MPKNENKNQVEEKKGYSLWQLVLALVLGVIVTAGVLYVPSFGGQGFIGGSTQDQTKLPIVDVFSISKALKQNISETYDVLGDIEAEIRGVGADDISDLVKDLNDQLAKVEIELNASLKALNENFENYDQATIAKGIAEVNGLVNLAKLRAKTMLTGLVKKDLTLTNSIVSWDLNLDGKDELTVDLRKSIPSFFEESLKFLDSASIKMENLRIGIYPNPVTN